MQQKMLLALFLMKTNMLQSNHHTKPMPERERRPSADQQGRDERLAGVLHTLEQGIEAILTSEGYRQYLETMSRFHGYSFNNVALIMAQKPDATHVAGFNTWRELGRFVRKGEKGMKILVPHRVKVAEPEDEQEPQYIVRGFGVGTVFDVSQTDGTPLPEPPRVRELTGEDAASAHVTDRLTAFLLQEGMTLSRADTGSAKGYYAPRRREIVLSRDIRGDQEAKTLTHETAHYLADHRGDIDRGDAETVAESAAYVVMHHNGIDTGAYSFAYVARWATDMQVFRRNLHAVQQVSHRLIAVIGDTCEPDGE
jgi:antirestriction protein ArdC